MVVLPLRSLLRHFLLWNDKALSMSPICAFALSLFHMGFWWTHTDMVHCYYQKETSPGKYYAVITVYRKRLQRGCSWSVVLKMKHFKNRLFFFLITSSYSFPPLDTTNLPSWMMVSVIRPTCCECQGPIPWRYIIQPPMRNRRTLQRMASHDYVEPLSATFATCLVSRTEEDP